MADNGSSNPEVSSEDRPTARDMKHPQFLSFTIKVTDTCCEQIKIVKIHSKAIENLTEKVVNIQVDSKGEGKWHVQYKALDYKVGSLSDDTNTVGYNITEKSVTRFLKELTGKPVNGVEYLSLDCDTMHTIVDVVVTEENTEGNRLTDSEAETKQDMTNTNRGDKETQLIEGRNKVGDEEEVEEAKPAPGPLCPISTFGHESEDNEKLEVSVQTSKNLGYRRLKLSKIQNPITKSQHQLLFIFKSDQGSYLKKPKPNTVKDLVTSYVNEFDLRPNVAIMANGPKYSLLMFLNSQGRGANNTFIAVGLDWVPCLKLPQWPKEAEEWITRDRKSNWPKQECIDIIRKSGCHLVPKSHSDNRDDVTEWRISFSEVERILTMQLSEMQKACFRMFKMVTQLHCKVIVDEKEECPSSYALKTIFLWACEEIEPITWEQEVGSCFLTLFEKFAEALEKKSIQGYFIREMNLIGHLDTNLIQEYLGTVQEILREPIRFLKETWKLIIEPKLGWTFDRTFGELIRCADKSEESQDIAQARCCLNLALMINDYICQGAVTRNSFLMKMFQEIYGYQRSNKADMKMIENKVAQNLHVAESDNRGLHIVEELLDICWHISSKHAANPAVRFGIHPQAFILSGDVDYMQGRVHEAKKNFEKAIEILTTEGCRVAARSMSRVHTQYAKCLAALKAPNAMQEYKKALRLDRNNTEANVFVVMHLYNTDQKEVAETIIEGVFGCQIVNSGAKRSLRLLPKENMNMIQLSRGDLTLLDEVLCSEVKALLNWPVNISRVPYGSMSEPVLKVSVPEAVILSLLYMKGQEITKATLNNELRPWVNLIADAGKTGRADCQYIVNSLLGMMHHKAGNYWEALKLLQGQAKTSYCSEMVLAYLDLLNTLFKITIE